MAFDFINSGGGTDPAQNTGYLLSKEVLSRQPPD
jgi:hypothetical protein